MRRSRPEAYAGVFEQVSRQADASWSDWQARMDPARAPGLERKAEPLRTALQVRGRLPETA